MKAIKIICIWGALFLLSCEKDKIDPQRFDELVEALEFLNQPDEIPVPIEVEVIDTAEAPAEQLNSQSYQPSAKL